MNVVNLSWYCKLIIIQITFYATPQPQIFENNTLLRFWQPPKSSNSKHQVRVKNDNSLPSSIESMVLRYNDVRILTKKSSSGLSEGISGI